MLAAQDGSISRIESCLGIPYARMLFWPTASSSCRVAMHGAGFRVVHEICATDRDLQQLFNGRGSEVFTADLNIRPLTIDVMRHIVVPRCLPAEWLAATGIKKYGGGAEERVVIDPVAPTDPTQVKCAMAKLVSPGAGGGHHNCLSPDQCEYANKVITDELLGSVASYNDFRPMCPSLPKAFAASVSYWREVDGLSGIRIGTVTSLEWLSLFWDDMTGHVERKECTWDQVIQTFNDMVLFPGANDVAFPIGAAVTPVIWLDNVRSPIRELLGKVGGCSPSTECVLPPTIVQHCTQKANGPGCLNVVCWCVLKNDSAEATFDGTTREERHALLRMLGALERFTPSQLALVSSLPIVEVWKKAALISLEPRTTARAMRKSASMPAYPPISKLNDVTERVFVSVQKVSRKGEIFQSDGTSHAVLVKGRKARSLVLTVEGATDQYNAGVVGLLQACAHVFFMCRQRQRHDKSAEPPSLDQIALDINDGQPVSTLSFAFDYRMQHCHGQSALNKQADKWGNLTPALRAYNKPWLNGSTIKLPPYSDRALPAARILDLDTGGAGAAPPATHMQRLGRGLPRTSSPELEASRRGGAGRTPAEARAVQLQHQLEHDGAQAALPGVRAEDVQAHAGVHAAPQ